MTARIHWSRRPRPARRATADQSRKRAFQSAAYVAATVLGGLGALVLVGLALTSGDAGARELVTWSALAALLLGAAAYHWWVARPAQERSRRLAAGLGSAEVADAVDASSGEVDAVRRLRVAHPGLGLLDANELVQRHVGKRH